MFLRTLAAPSVHRPPRAARGFDITNFQEDSIGMPVATGLLHGDMDTAVCAGSRCCAAPRSLSITLNWKH